MKRIELPFDRLRVTSRTQMPLTNNNSHLTTKSHGEPAGRRKAHVLQAGGPVEP